MAASPFIPGFLSRFRPWIATGAAWLVLALSVLAVSPNLHDALHHEGETESDACAVVLFSNGVSTPIDVAIVVPPAHALPSSALRSAGEIFLIPARYLRRPERGPPVS